MASPSENWNWLSEESRAAPILNGAPVLRLRDRRCLIRSGSSYGTAAGALALIVGAGLLVIVWLVQKEFSPRASTIVLLASVASILGWIGTTLLLRRNSIFWAPSAKRLVIRHDALFSSRSLAVAREAVVPELRVETAQGTGIGKTALLLHHVSAPSQPIVLARSENRDALAELFKAINEFTGERGVDATTETLCMPDGSRLQCPRVTVGKSAAKFKTKRLEFAGDEVARFVPTKFAVAVFGGSFVAVIAVIIAICFSSDSAVGGMMSHLIGAVATWSGLWAFSGADAEMVVADRNRGTVTTKHWLRLPWKRHRRFLLADIAAIQLCSRWTSRQGSEGHWVYELNIVFRIPTGGRISVVTDTDRRRLFREGELFARFLKLPLLDHAGPSLEGDAGESND